ncbi:unnamed protein product [Ceratitis capitata]|uniref:(Mediterranean fruit fly) hypothetical protein n=1 Tax=Ceratitis capitata TaxID=7213 RepID=A0A811UBF8_CERCA|nr:unnamed protein product [Ceratitis capitata]
MYLFPFHSQSIRRDCIISGFRKTFQNIAAALTLCYQLKNSCPKTIVKYCSELTVRITGLPLNEHNLPMMLPNGQIFGQLAIPQITREDGAVVCPITNTKFSNPKVEKVFVM